MRQNICTVGSWGVRGAGRPSTSWCTRSKCGAISANSCTAWLMGCMPTPSAVACNCWRTYSRPVWIWSLRVLGPVIHTKPMAVLQDLGRARAGELDAFHQGARREQLFPGGLPAQRAQRGQLVCTDGTANAERGLSRGAAQQPGQPLGRHGAGGGEIGLGRVAQQHLGKQRVGLATGFQGDRSEEHTSEL